MHHHHIGTMMLLKLSLLGATDGTELAPTLDNFSTVLPAPTSPEELIASSITIMYVIISCALRSLTLLSYLSRPCDLPPGGNDIYEFACLTLPRFGDDALCSILPPRRMLICMCSHLRVSVSIFSYLHCLLPLVLTGTARPPANAGPPNGSSSLPILIQMFAGPPRREKMRLFDSCMVRTRA